MTNTSAHGCLPKAFLTFLRDLRAHNNKAWFEANRERFEADVQEPARALVRDLATRLQSDFPYIVGSDAKAGGSLTRLHRDTRFSKDKSPYHTHLGFHFWNRDGRKMETPGFFLRVSSEEVLLGTGLHQPEPPLLLRIREAIDADSAAWRKVSRNVAFVKQWGGLEGDSLKRVPAPWSADHLDAADLRRQDFTAFIRRPARSATAAGFAKEIVTCWKASKPLMDFLTSITPGVR